MRMNIALLNLFIALVIIACGRSNVATETNSNGSAADGATPIELGKNKDKDDSGDSDYINLFDDKLKAVGEKSLRKLQLESSDLEIRIWAGYEIQKMRGILIKKRKGSWSGKVVTLESLSKSGTLQHYALKPPKSGWEVFWGKLQSFGIVDLRDDSEVGAVEPFEDSQIVIIEVLVAQRYRSYSYNAPCLSKAEDGEKLVAILNTLSDEFNVNLPKCVGD